MSKAGVIVALLVAVALAGVAILVGGRGNRPAAATGRLLDFDPAKVVEIRVDKPEGGFEAVRRGRDPGAWTVVTGDPGSKESEPWPAGATQVRSVLRILSTLTPERPADPGADLDPQARTVSLMLEGGGKQQLRISPRALGGMVLAGSGERLGWVGADVGKMLAVSGPRDWRDPTALPGLGLDISKVTLRGQAGTVELGRVQGRWGVRAPVAEPAEPDAVVKLLAALQSVRITDFLDGGPAGPTGLDSPIAELAVESVTRSADGGEPRTVRTSLEAGQAAEMGARTVFARLTREGSDSDYSRVAVVSGEELAEISTDPAAYLSRRALGAPAADVAGIVVTAAGAPAREYRRTLDGWTGGEGTAVPKVDADSMAALIDLLSQTPAERVAYGEGWPASWGAPGRELAGLELQGAGGVAIGRVRVLVAASGGQPEHIVVRSGPVWRAYGAGVGAAAAAWLAKQL